MVYAVKYDFLGLFMISKSFYFKKIYLSIINRDALNSNRIVFRFWWLDFGEKNEKT